MCKVNSSLPINNSTPHTPPLGVECGEGVFPSPPGEGTGEKEISIFGLQIATFGALWGLFLRLVDCFGHRQPLHDSLITEYRPYAATPWC